MKLILSTGFFLLAFSAIAQPANPYNFCPAVEITEAPPDDGSSLNFLSSGQHYTAFRGDTVYVVWPESRNSTPPTGNHVFFSKSTDKGKTFGPNIRVNSTSSGFKPSMRVDTSGIIYVAYDRSGDIFFTKSTDGGNSFISAIEVVDSAGLPYGQAAPSIAANNKGHVFISWVDYRTSPQSIFTAASYNGGLSFGANVQISTPGLRGDTPDIATDDSGRVFIVWSVYESPKTPIYLSRSDDSGQTFLFRSYVSDLPTDTSDAWALNPSLTIGNDSIVGVAWLDIRFDQWSIRFSISADYGQTFFPSVRVDEDLDPSCCPQPTVPSLSLQNRFFYIAFGASSSNATSLSGIYLTYRSTDVGSVFAPNVNASATDGMQSVRGGASLSVNENGEAFVTWVDNRYDPFLGEILHLFGALGKATVQKGDLNLDCLLTPTDVVMVLNAVFLGQFFPAPFENADGNCSGDLTPADIVLLLKAVFQSLPFPC